MTSPKTVWKCAPCAASDNEDAVVEKKKNKKAKTEESAADPSGGTVTGENALAVPAARLGKKFSWLFCPLVFAALRLPGLPWVPEGPWEPAAGLTKAKWVAFVATYRADFLRRGLHELKPYSTWFDQPGHLRAKRQELLLYTPAQGGGSGVDTKIEQELLLIAANTRALALKRAASEVVDVDLTSMKTTSSLSTKTFSRQKKTAKRPN